MAVVIKDERNNVLTKLTQWDYNRYLTITGLSLLDYLSPNVHFYNKHSSKALVMPVTLVTNGFRVKVPDILLTQSETIIAYVFAKQQTAYIDPIDFIGASIYKFEIPVEPRLEPVETEA